MQLRREAPLSEYGLCGDLERGELDREVQAQGATTHVFQVVYTVVTWDVDRKKI